MRNRLVSLGIGLALLGEAPAILAGGFVGSGGDIIKDSHNPWFLDQNVKTVQYCIDFDQASMSTSIDHARAVVQAAISFWQSSFNRVQRGNSPLWVGLGHQNFVETPCTGAEDLRFNFGWGSLDAGQKDYFIKTDGGQGVGIGEILGIAVRTSYDPVQLRGRGFIYIASDEGPYAYDGGQASVPQAWSYDISLFAVVAHELGHVFGLVHTTDFSDLMNEQFPQLMIQDFIISTIGNLPISSMPAGYGDYFNLPSSVNACDKDLDPGLRQLLGMGATSCIRLTAGDAALATWNWVEEAKDGTTRVIGQSVHAGESTGQTIFVYYTPQEAVFPPPPPDSVAQGLFQYFYGPTKTQFSSATGTLTLATGGKLIPVTMSYMMGRFSVSVTDGANSYSFDDDDGGSPLFSANGSTHGIR